MSILEYLTRFANASPGFSNLLLAINIHLVTSSGDNFVSLPSLVITANIFLVDVGFMYPFLLGF
nr:MAG TPA: hypothetical protein [Bacteriophage sp.]